MLRLKRRFSKHNNFQAKYAGFKDIIKKNKIGPLYTYNKNETKSKTTTTSTHYMDRTSFIIFYKHDKEKTKKTNKHAL